jgi:OmpA-OmpF porin, OOP family
MRRSILLRFAFGLALACLAGPAAAADDTDKWYVAPMFYGVLTGDDRHVADSTAFGLVAGKNISDNWSLELGYSFGTFRGVAPYDHLNLDTINVDGLRHFYRDSRVHPYLVLGVVEGIESRPSTGRYTRQMLEGGLGLLTRLYTSADHSSVLQLRTEAKARWSVDWFSTSGQGSPADVVGGVGLQFNWGAPAPVPAPIKEEPPPPPPPPPAAPPAPKDSDGDGVPDDIDECPNTPPGVKVDAKGCPLDSDHDGVPDYLDKCPGTPLGIKVDANGCEIEEIVLKGVNFDFDSSKLTQASEAVLNDVVTLLKLRPGSPAILGGHTDSRGKPAYNQKLSERRAKAVRDYLVANGIPAESLTAKGYGDSKPIASNKTDEGRAQNRRVTLEFTRLATR